MFWYRLVLLPLSLHMCINVVVFFRLVLSLIFLFELVVLPFFSFGVLVSFFFLLKVPFQCLQGSSHQHPFLGFLVTYQVAALFSYCFYY